MANIVKERPIRKNKVLFPLSFKLSITVCAILILFLGSIIFSVWFLFGLDIRNTAQIDNDGINTRTASAVESRLGQIYLETSLVLGQAKTETQELLFSYFYHRNPGIAAVISISPDRNTETIINNDFFHNNGLEEFLAMDFFHIYRSRLPVDSRETVLLNAEEIFYGLPILAFGFPYNSSHYAIILFSSAELEDYFAYSANQSFLVSHSGEILIQSGSFHGGDAIAESVINYAIHDLSAIGINRDIYSDIQNHINYIYREEFLSSEGVYVSGRNIGYDAALITLVPASLVYEGINTTSRRNIYLALSILFISLLLISLFAYSLTKQLVILRKAAEDIENGKYQYPIPFKVYDESGYLAQRMEAMRLALQNFELFTNKEIALNTIKGILKPGGAIKKAVFLFSDIRSFTAISENMTPENLIYFINSYMERMVAAIMATGGVIDKFIGDAILAHWGAVAEEERDDEATYIKASLRSALLMRASLQCLNQRVTGRIPPRINSGIGISSGKIAAGIIGTDERLVYTAMGDAVAQAEKLEALNKQFGTEIQVSSHTAKMVKDDFIFEEFISSDTFALVNVKSEEQTRLLIKEMEGLPKIRMAVARQFAGPEGPKTLYELRKILDISAKEINKVFTDDKEKKFKIQEA